MPETTAHYATVSLRWGDGEHTFCLDIGGLRELKAKTGAGPYSLWRRLQSLDFEPDDIRETLRIGLIRGGMEPNRALVLVEIYCDNRPLLENVKFASTVLAAALTGPIVKKKAHPPRAPRKTKRTTASTTQPSSPTASSSETSIPATPTGSGSGNTTSSSTHGTTLTSAATT